MSALGLSVRGKAERTSLGYSVSPLQSASWMKGLCYWGMLAPGITLAAGTPPPVATVSMGGLLQVMFGLGLVLAAIAGTAWLLKWLSRGQLAAAGALRVIGGVAVGPKERVVLVDIGDTRLVLGVAPGQVNVLHQMPRPAEEGLATAYEPAAGKFYERLKDILQRDNKDADHAAS